MNLLFTADWHFRRTIPICRKDNFFETQIKVLKQIAQIAIDNNAIIIHAGDIFNKAKPESSQELECLLYEIFKDNEIYFIAGNHDLINHSLDNFNKGSIGVLANYENWKHINFINNEDYLLIDFFDYNKEIYNVTANTFKIAVIHKYTEKENLPIFMKDGITAKELLKQYNYDIFVTGDNHTGFIYKENNRFVINPGCITRQVSDKKYYTPFVVLFNTNTLKYEQIYLCDNKEDDVDNSHIEEIQIKEDRINSFIEKLKNQSKFDLDFINNMKIFLLENQIEKSVEEIIFKIIEKEK